MTSPSLPLTLLTDDAAIRENVPDEAQQAVAIANADTAGRSVRGIGRRHNEDQFLVARLERLMHVSASGLPVADGTTIDDGAQSWVLVVADGVGGHGDGEVASAVAVDALARFAFVLMPWLVVVTPNADHTLRVALSRAFAEAEARLRRVARRENLDPKLATTVTMAVTSGSELFVVHAGDCRAYLLRHGELRCLTADHTLAGELASKGVAPTSEESRLRLENLLVNVVGGTTRGVHIDLHRTRVEPGDALLLCTDGLHHFVTPEAILAALQLPSATEAVDALLAAAVAAGSEDDITAIVARL